MRKIAERLGVGTMSLYRYVPGKGELLDLMYDRVVGEERRAPDEGRGWRAQLEEWSHIALASHLRHPWLLEIVAGNRPPLGPNVMDSYEALLAIVNRSGLAPEQVTASVELLAVYIRGAARSAVEAAQTEARTGISDEQWWEARSDFWETYFDAERFPTLTAIYAGGGHDQRLDQFAFGLARVLDGIEALLEAPAPDGG
jgi:AcrR family transcriptional regulator